LPQARKGGRNRKDIREEKRELGEEEERIKRGERNRKQRRKFGGINTLLLSRFRERGPFSALGNCNRTLQLVNPDQMNSWIRVVPR
jgi:hypothetical protein